MLLHPFNELEFNLTIRSTSPLIVKEARFTDGDRKEWAKEHETVRAKIRARASETEIEKAVDKVKEGMPNVIPISRASKDEIKAAVLDPDPREALRGFPFYIPGATLRGVCRSELERMLRGFENPLAPRVCDPFEEDVEHPAASCSKALHERRESGREFHPYTLSCPVCRLFGSTLQASRVRFSEGERVPCSGELAQREHVRIDRRSGRVDGAPLRFFGLLNADFRFTVTVRNFELWQVKLLGVLRNSLAAGEISFGSGRSKGYGRVKLVKTDIVLRYFSSTRPDDRLRGVTEHPDEATRSWFIQRYGLTANDSEAPAIEGCEWGNPQSPWIWQTKVQPASFDKVWPALNLGWDQVKPLADRLA